MDGAPSDQGTIGMRMRQQLIIVVAVVFATVAVGVNVFASTRGAEQRAEKLAVEVPVASVLDRGVFDNRPLADPVDDTEELNDPCSKPGSCQGGQPDDEEGTVSTHPYNHGLIVSGYAKHIGYDEVAGPPGLMVRNIARLNGDKDGRHPLGLDKDDKQPPGLDRSDQQPPGQDKDDKQPPGKNKDG